jgi:signal peptidase I
MENINLIIYAFLLVVYSVSLWKIFEKNNIEGWKAIVPGYNLFLWLKLLNKPWWWLILFIFPGVNVLMLMVLNVITASAFGKNSLKDGAIAAFLPFIYMPYLGFSDIKFIGVIEDDKAPKSTLKEWGDAIIFAVVAASIIRTYFLEAFTIPTSSMEKSMLIGDYLFVSKMSYGPKIPQTPLSFPFAHHTMPFTVSTKSYLEWMKLPYYRLPGFGEVKRNDVVVFNYPDGDTVVVDQQNRGYQQILRDNAFFHYKLRDLQAGNPLKTDNQYVAIARKVLHNSKEITVRPVDKRENYIKRCVGVGGDKLQVINGELFINDEKAFTPQEMQYNYNIQTSGSLNKKTIKENFNVNEEDFDNGLRGNNYYNLPLTNENYDKMKSSLTSVKDIQPDFAAQNEIKPMMKNILLQYNGHQVGSQIIKTLEDNKQYDPQLQIFPNHPNFNWTEDNFGPIQIPAKGETINLTLDNLPIYQRAITLYEGNQLKVEGDRIFINDMETLSYTFSMNYYFMMGDNRHNSADSRYWGFVPEDHVVGKAVFVWLSLDKERGLTDGKIRWNRLFSFVK